MKIALVGKGKQTDIQNKCLECVVFYDLAKQNIPCNGAFPEHCEYNGTEEEEEGKAE
jgi:hypothetical protein